MTAAAQRSGKALSLIGRRFGSLLVTAMDEQRAPNGGIRWRCRCDCGGECTVIGSLLTSGRKTHCGCQSQRGNACVDISGQKFHRLTALFPLEKRDRAGYVVWRCRCDCGSEIDVSYNALVHANMKSCGCRKKEHDRALKGYLNHVAGTSIEMLKSTKVPANNSTGVKGVYRVKDRFVAKIVFQKKQYVLGTFQTIEDAARARRAAEESVNQQVVAYYDWWKEKAQRDPAWAGLNPVQIEVQRGAEGQIRLMFTPVCERETRENGAAMAERAASYAVQG